jgi:hypothetical protein
MKDQCRNETCDERFYMLHVPFSYPVG